MYSKVVARQLEEAKNIVLAVGKNADKVSTALKAQQSAGDRTSRRRNGVLMGL